jgi:hypothetical protein
MTRKDCGRINPLETARANGRNSAGVEENAIKTKPTRRSKRGRESDNQEVQRESRTDGKTDETDEGLLRNEPLFRRENKETNLKKLATSADIQFLLAQERKKDAGGKSPKRTAKVKQELALDYLIAVSCCRENITIITNDGDFYIK